MKKSSSGSVRRGDGQWLAWGASGLLTFMLAPAYFDIAVWIYIAFVADELWRYELAQYLVYPIFVVCLITGFFGCALLIRLLPQIGFIAFLKSKMR